MDSVDKKRLWIFLAVAYGLTALMYLLMIIGLKNGQDLTVFVNAQMMYPAAGVILGKILVRREGERLPMGGYITFLIIAAVMVLLSLLSLVIKLDPIEYDMMGTKTTMDVWSMVSQYSLIIGSVIMYILFWTCGRQIRENAGLARRNIKMSIILVAVFVALFLGREFLNVTLTDAYYGNHDALEQLTGVVSNIAIWINVAALPFNYFLVFIAFFGEEYGWRYYLQPIMQNKFGKRLGVLLLGLVWGVWHIGADFMFYTKTDGPIVFVGQLITCVTVGIFFGYAYMKTQNIWVPVIMHFINNQLAALLAGGTADALQGQSYNWIDVPISLVSSIVLALFIFMPVYSSRSKEKGTEVQTIES
ncbi:CAAX protease self-immunity [Ruminococcaceae bacterium YRB3002]|nr:CAAX protease self-immunity [Ruminococcaceae bacterium YRB3002]